MTAAQRKNKEKKNQPTQGKLQEGEKKYKKK